MGVTTLWMVLKLEVVREYLEAFEQITGLRLPCTNWDRSREKAEFSNTPAATSLAISLLCARDGWKPRSASGTVSANAKPKDLRKKLAVMDATTPTKSNERNEHEQ